MTTAFGARSSGRDVRLAVVLVVVVAGAGRGVEPEPVLGRVLRVVGVRARPAVAVAEVDDDRRARDGRLDLRPGRVRAVDLDDVRGVLDRLGVGPVGVGAVAGGRAVRRPDDDHDLGVRAVAAAAAARRRRRRQGGEHGEGERTAMRALRKRGLRRRTERARGSVPPQPRSPGRGTGQSRDGPASLVGPSGRAGAVAGGGAGVGCGLRVRARQCRRRGAGAATQLGQRRSDGFVGPGRTGSAARPASPSTARPRHRRRSDRPRRSRARRCRRTRSSRGRAARAARGRGSRGRRRSG